MGFNIGFWRWTQHGRWVERGIKKRQKEKLYDIIHVGRFLIILTCVNNRFTRYISTNLAGLHWCLHVFVLFYEQYSKLVGCYGGNNSCCVRLRPTPTPHAIQRTRVGGSVLCAVQGLLRNSWHPNCVSLDKKCRTAYALPPVNRS